MPFELTVVLHDLPLHSFHFWCFSTFILQIGNTFIQTSDKITFKRGFAELIVMPKHCIERQFPLVWEMDQLTSCLSNYNLLIIIRPIDYPFRKRVFAINLKPKHCNKSRGSPMILWIDYIDLTITSKYILLIQAVFKRYSFIPSSFKLTQSRWKFGLISYMDNEFTHAILLTRILWGFVYPDTILLANTILLHTFLHVFRFQIFLKKC